MASGDNPAWGPARYREMFREGMRFYEARPDLCDDGQPPALPPPSMPERESRWLSEAGPEAEKKVRTELELTNEFLARYGFPLLMGAFSLDGEGRPRVVVRPLAPSGAVDDAASFGMPVEDFSSHGAHLFVRGMDAARRLSRGSVSEAQRAHIERLRDSLEGY